MHLLLHELQQSFFTSFNKCLIDLILTRASRRQVVVKAGFEVRDGFLIRVL